MRGGRQVGWLVGCWNDLNILWNSSAGTRIVDAKSLRKEEIHTHQKLRVFLP